MGFADGFRNSFNLMLRLREHQLRQDREQRLADQQQATLDQLKRQEQEEEQLFQTLFPERTQPQQQQAPSQAPSNQFPQRLPGDVTPTARVGPMPDPEPTAETQPLPAQERVRGQDFPPAGPPVPLEQGQQQTLSPEQIEQRRTGLEVAREIRNLAAAPKNQRKNLIESLEQQQGVTFEPTMRGAILAADDQQMARVAQNVSRAAAQNPEFVAQALATANRDPAQARQLVSSLFGQGLQPEEPSGQPQQAQTRGAQPAQPQAPAQTREIPSGPQPAGIRPQATGAQPQAAQGELPPQPGIPQGRRAPSPQPQRAPEPQRPPSEPDQSQVPVRALNRRLERVKRLNEQIASTTDRMDSVERLPISIDARRQGIQLLDDRRKRLENQRNELADETARTFIQATRERGNQDATERLDVMATREDLLAQLPQTEFISKQSVAAQDRRRELIEEANEVPSSALREEDGTLKTSASNAIRRNVSTLLGGRSEVDPETGIVTMQGIPAPNREAALRVTAQAERLARTGEARSVGEATEMAADQLGMSSVLQRMKRESVDTNRFPVPPKTKEKLATEITDFLDPTLALLDANIQAIPFATGPINTVQDLLSNFGAFFRGQPIFDDPVQAQAGIAQINRTLKDAYKINPRFPGWENDDINELIVSPGEFVANPRKSLEKYKAIILNLQYRRDYNAAMLRGDPLPKAPVFVESQREQELEQVVPGYDREVHSRVRPVVNDQEQLAKVPTESVFMDGRTGRWYVKTDEGDQPESQPGVNMPGQGGPEDPPPFPGTVEVEFSQTDVDRGTSTSEMFQQGAQGVADFFDENTIGKTFSNLARGFNTVVSGIPDALPDMVIGALKAMPRDPESFTLAAAGLPAEAARTREQREQAFPIIDEADTGFFQASLANYGLGFDLENDDIPMAGRIGQALGTSASALLGIGIMAKTGLGATGIMAPAVQAFRQAPGLMTANELSAATGAGTFAGAAREIFPGDPTAEILAEFAGGFVNVPGRALGISSKAAGRVRSTSRSYLSTDGNMRNAADIIRRTLGEERAGEALRRIQNPRSSFPSGAQPTAADLADMEEMTILERSLIRESAQFRDNKVDKASATMEALRREADDIAGEVADPQAFRQTLQQRVDYLDQTLDAYVLEKTRIARERMRRLDPDARNPGERQRVQRIAQNELSEAETVARAQEAAFYAPIDMSTRVGQEAPSIRGVGVAQGQEIDAFSEARQVVASTLRNIGEGGRESIVPGEFRRKLGRLNARGEFQRGTLGPEVEFRELINLRSDALARAREEAGKGPTANRQRIRFLNQLQEGLLNDMQKISTTNPEVLDQLEQARAFSRLLNDKFTRGPVAKILGMDAAGEPRLPPEAALEQTIGGGAQPRPEGARAARQMDEAMRIAGPRGPKVNLIDIANRNPKKLRDAVKDHLRFSFVDAAATRQADGTLKVDPAQAAKFRDRYGELLRSYPEVNVQLTTAARQQRVADRVSRSETARRKSLHDRRRSRATMWLESRVGEEVENLAKFSNNPRRDTQLLLNRAQRDPSGEAVRGFRQSILDNIIGGAMVDNFMETGRSGLSGAAIRKKLRDPKMRQVINTALTREQLGRLETLAAQAQRVEASLRPGRTVQDLKNPALQPNMVSQLFRRLSGSAFGRRLSSALGRRGGGLIEAQAGSRFLQQLSEEMPQGRALMALQDMVLDRNLFVQGMKTIRDIPDGQSVQRALNAWVIDTFPAITELDSESIDRLPVPTLGTDREGLQEEARQFQEERQRQREAR